MYYFFLKAGADLEILTCEGYTPLLLAARNGHVGVVKALVKVIADLQTKIPVEAALHCTWMRNSGTWRLRRRL